MSLGVESLSAAIMWVAKRVTCEFGSVSLAICELWVAAQAVREFSVVNQPSGCKSCYSAHRLKYGNEIE